ncbi:MAG TPA: hypothetical protein PK213_13605 [Deltaproteobacteria bacterium]|nr:hypothetical protein [Deltaproteobacteria bacterium]
MEKRFCGPPDSGNGGYVCGRLAKYVTGIAEVRLMKPPPLEKDLAVSVQDDGSVLLIDGDIVIAKATPSSLDLEVPAPPALDEAADASTRYICAEDHFFPTCFVCGPKRKLRDGLRIFPGPLEGRGVVASPWTPDDTLLDEGGEIGSEFIWASLDCPGAFAVIGSCVRPVVLGSLTAVIMKKPSSGQPCITMGWEIESQGRKRFAGTALCTREGEILAKAKAVWIEI